MVMDSAPTAVLMWMSVVAANNVIQTKNRHNAGFSFYLSAFVASSLPHLLPLFYLS